MRARASVGKEGDNWSYSDYILAHPLWASAQREGQPGKEQAGTGRVWKQQCLGWGKGKSLLTGVGINWKTQLHVKHICLIPACVCSYWLYDCKGLFQTTCFCGSVKRDMERIPGQGVEGDEHKCCHLLPHGQCRKSHIQWSIFVLYWAKFW